MLLRICGYGGIGRRVRLRGVWATIRVQVPVTAPKRRTSRLGSFFALVRLPGLHRITASQSSAVHPVHAVVFRARFAARHDSRLGQPFCGLSRLMSLAYQRGKLRSIRRKILAKFLARYFVVSLERHCVKCNFVMRIIGAAYPNGAHCKASPGDQLAKSGPSLGPFFRFGAVTGTA